MPRKKRQLDRDAGVVRDATLVVIASEDKYAVENYFQRFRTRKVQFRVLPTLDCNAAPLSILERIDEFRRSEEVEDHDEFWICIDSDHWTDPGHIANLVQVLRECRSKGYHVAINNPCIELWFLLHFVDYTAPQTADRARCNETISQLELAIGQRYHKDRCNRIRLNTAQVIEAVRRAKAMDTEDSIMPTQPSARIYKIVEMLKERDSIDLGN